MLTRKTLAITYIRNSLIIIFVAWATLLVLEEFSVALSGTQSVTDEELFTLKAPASDVIYSEAYRTEAGDGEVKYAYLQDEVMVEEGEDITRRTPSSKTYVLHREENIEAKTVTETLKTVFYSDPQMYRDGGTWRHIEYATTTPEGFAASGAIHYVKKREFWERLLPGKPVFAETSTFDIRSGAYDGYITISTVGSRECWTAAYSATSGDSFNNSGTLSYARVQAFSQELVNCTVWRSFLDFDISSLPSGADLQSATLSVYVTGVNDGMSDSNAYMTLTGATGIPTDVAYYDDVDGTEFNTGIDIGTISSSAYLDLALNASGLTYLQNTDSNFAVRHGFDTNSYTGFTPDTTIRTSGITFRTSEQTGTSEDPKLEITYTATEPFSMGFWFPF